MAGARGGVSELTVASSLAGRLGHTGTLARVYTQEFDDLQAGDRRNTMSGQGRPPYIALDLAVRNATGGPAKITIDGQELTVPVSGLEVTDTPFNELNVLSVGDGGGPLDVTLQGIPYELARTLAAGVGR